MTDRAPTMTIYTRPRDPPTWIGLRPPFLTPKWRVAAQLVMAAALLATLGPSLWNERYYPVLAVLALAAALALAWLLDWWRRMPVVAAIVLLNLLLIFAYLWSLDESVHITIRTTPKGYVAQVGAGKGTLPRPVVGGSIGLYSGLRESLRVQPTGEAPMPAKQDLLAQFGEWIRLVPSGPAWSNARLVTSGNGSRDFSQLGSQALSRAGWSHDRRGELRGSPGSLLRLPAPPGNYVFSADLLRSDGAQGMVVGLNHSNGYLLLVRFDQPDGIWTDWRGGPSTDLIGGVPVAENLALIPMIQRDTRLLLGSWVLALILAGLAIPLYLLLTALLRLLPGPGGPNFDFAKSWLSRPALIDMIAALAAAAALLFTALISSQLLDRMPHVQDSVAYLFQARTFAMGHLSVPAPPLHRFFNQEFIPAFHGRWFSKYPPGWPLLLAVGVLFGAPWLVNPVLAGASLFLLYLIGREVYGRSVALLATLLGLSSPFFLFLGGSFMAHSATLFYLTGFAYLFIRWLKRFGGKTAESRQVWKGHILLLLAGFLLGMAFITRQLDAIAFAIPFACAFLLWSRRLLSATWPVIGGAIPVLGMLLYDWHLTGSPLRTPYSLWWKFDHLSFGADVGLSGFTVPHGFWNTSINLEFLQAHLFGWPFYFALALAAIPFVLGRFTGWDAVFGASAICVIGSYTFYWNPGIMYGPRYYYVAIPWFALLSVRGLQELYRLPLRLPLSWAREPVAALFGPGLLLVLLLAFDLSVYLPAQIPIYRGYNFITPDSVNAVHRARVHHVLIFVVENPAWAWWPYGSVFSDMSPMWKDSDRIYVKNKGAANAKLMRLFPGRRYYLLDGTRLHRIGSG